MVAGLRSTQGEGHTRQKVACSLISRGERNSTYVADALMIPSNVREGPSSNLI